MSDAWLPDVQRAADALAADLTPKRADVMPSPVLRRWGSVDADNGDGTYDVLIAGIVIPGVAALASVEVDADCVVDFSGSDPLIVGQTSRAMTPFSYAANWGDSAGVAPGGWSIDSSGFVHLHGAVAYDGTKAAGWVTVCNLPAIARPAVALTAAAGPIVYNVGGTITPGVWIVESGGDFRLYSAGTAVAPAFYLGGISYHPRYG